MCIWDGYVCIQRDTTDRRVDDGGRWRGKGDRRRGNEGESAREPANRTKQRNRITRGDRPYFSCVNFPNCPDTYWQLRNRR